MKANKSNFNAQQGLKKAIASAACVILCLIFTTQANAQVGFSLGPKAGAIVSNFSGDDNGNWSARTSWSAGAFANLHLGEVFSFQPEFLIQQRGAQQDVSGTKNVVKLNYFSVPLLFKLAIPIQGTFYPHFFAGPVYNYRLGAKYTATDGGTVSFNDGDLRRTEIAGAAGIGLDIISNNVFFNIDARYNIGISDINNSDQDVHLKSRSMSVMAGIGYRFGTPK